MDNLIARKIEENSAVKINYRSDIDGQVHYIRGFLIGETERFFQVEGGRYHDVIAIPKTGIVSMIFEKPKHEKPKPEIIPDPATKPYSKKKEEFSYGNWWKNANIQKAKE